MRTVIAIGRLTLFLLASILTLIIQSTLMLFTKGPVTLVWPKIFHAYCTRLMGIKVIVEGEIAGGLNTVYVGNHISYMDIPVMGSIIKGAFVAKKDVESWPFFGVLGKMGRTVYMSRDPAHAKEAAELLTSRLNEPSPVIIFPEGTTSDGKQILPFKSTIFELFLNKKIVLQPFTISIIGFDGQPVLTDEDREKYVWIGDMTLLPHLWKFAKRKETVLKLTFQEPILSSSFTNRKTLCAACYEGVVKGLDLSSLPEYGLPQNSQQIAV